jgi:phosphoribosylglycinamide formyltransferase-1
LKTLDFVDSLPDFPYLLMSKMKSDLVLRIAVFGSGRGSNFSAIENAVRSGKLSNVHLVLVISNNSSSGILELAVRSGIPAVHLSRLQFPDEDAYVNALLRTLDEKQVNFIVLAGYMKRLPSRLIGRFRNRIINIHPALLPKFGGKGMYGEHVHRAVLASGDKESGATVHVVDENYDSGPVVLQKRVPVLPSDTVESLSSRVLRVEHEIYPEAIRLFSEGRVSFSDHQVVVQHH